VLLCCCVVVLLCCCVVVLLCCCVVVLLLCCCVVVLLCCCVDVLMCCCVVYCCRVVINTSFFAFCFASLCFRYIMPCYLLRLSFHFLFASRSILRLLCFAYHHFATLSISVLLRHTKVRPIYFVFPLSFNSPSPSFCLH
jgi:hypothetical protein